MFSNAMLINRFNILTFYLYLKSLAGIAKREEGTDYIYFAIWRAKKCKIAYIYIYIYIYLLRLLQFGEVQSAK